MLPELPRLESSQKQCARCNKLSEAASEAERQAVQDILQCITCGVLYPFLKGQLCARCNEGAGSKDSEVVVVDHLLKQTTVHEATASAHRLTKRPQNSSLKKASDITKQTQTLKMLSKVDTVGVKVTLWCYPAARSKGNGKPRQIQIPAIVQSFPAVTLISDAIEQLLVHAEKIYDKTMVADKPSPKPPFSRDKVVFAIVKTVHENSYLDIDEATTLGSIRALHEKLETEHLLSDKDIKGKCITMQLHLYETHADLVRADSTDEDDIQIVSGPKSPYSTRASIRASKRKLSTASSKTPQYVSAYRRRSAPENTSQTEYNIYNFQRTTFSVTSSGTIVEKLAWQSDIEMIQIPKNWRRHVNMDTYGDGYLGYGLVKFAFTGRLGSSNLAIFQLKDYVTELVNESDLTCELKLLAWGKFFLDSFIKRAKKFDANNIPDMKWNADGAFIGTLVEKLPTDAIGTKASQGLIWSTFLAVPLLARPLGPEAGERKFSGNQEAGDNTNSIGIWMDAYAHHTLVDSMGEFLFVDIQGFVYSKTQVVLFDPQAHTFDCSSGIWDKGRPGILQFLKEHHCNKICCKLGLNLTTLSIPQAEANDVQTLSPVTECRNLHRQWEL